MYLKNLIQAKKAELEAQTKQQEKLEIAQVALEQQAAAESEIIRADKLDSTLRKSFGRVMDAPYDLAAAVAENKCFDLDLTDKSAKTKLGAAVENWFSDPELTDITIEEALSSPHYIGFKAWLGAEGLMVTYSQMSKALQEGLGADVMYTHNVLQLNVVEI